MTIPPKRRSSPLGCYPERLGLCLLFGAPWVFGASWRLVKPILNKVTTDKVVFLDGGGKLSDESPARQKIVTTLSEQGWGAEQVTWMVNELIENRTKGWQTQKSIGSTMLAVKFTTPEERHHM